MKLVGARRCVSLSSHACVQFIKGVSVCAVTHLILVRVCDAHCLPQSIKLYCMSFQQPAYQMCAIYMRPIRENEIFRETFFGNRRSFG